MPKKQTGLYFDKDDYELLRIVKKVLSRTHKHQSMSPLMISSMHPHGIKEMAATSGLRIAYAIVQLLGSLETGKADDRLVALRSLRDEVFSSATSFYKKNTARVLMQIMKELVRNRGNTLRQLKLAHDFRLVSSGRPRLVRSELARYHLLEMPEEWNQFTFDDRVHDANTKGRKSATHLVMDAWIKGIRNLTVIYYNYVDPEVAEELLEAGSILDVHIRIGIEFSSQFLDKYVRITWSPHGFTDSHSLLHFLQERQVRELMEEGRQVSHYQQDYVFQVLEAFNSRHRHTLGEEFQLNVGTIDRHDFINSVGTGQPSLLHLAKFIHSSLQPQVNEEITKLQQQFNQVSSEGRQAVQARFNLLRTLSREMLIDHFLRPGLNPEINDPYIPNDDSPPLLRTSPQDLLNRLAALHSGAHFILSLSNLSIQDTLELLYDCQGMITHIEAYNLKDATHGLAANSHIGKSRGLSGEAVAIVNPERTYGLINSLQKALNEDNVIVLKRTIREIIWDFENSRDSLEKALELARKNRTPPDIEIREKAEELAAMEDRKQRLLNILFNIETFHTYYRKRSLGTRIGSSSTGQSEHQYGMGLVVLDTLPPRARHEVLQEVRQNRRKCLPITARMVNHHHSRSKSPGNVLEHLLSSIPGSRFANSSEWQDWSLESIELHPGRAGNVVTLGGLRPPAESATRLDAGDAEEKIDKPLKYLNTGIKNVLKVTLGFIPAFLTFSLTKDWWLLAYFGAVIWLGITCLRNIIQSILGGGGLRRSPLLQWNALISWSRVADSLLYTGFSVPLLDFLVKSLLLDQTFGITTSTNPVMLYSAMGLANGIYISSHNIFRGLPKSAAVANFFRSILAIPLAILFNALIATVLHGLLIPGVEEILQKWAAIISKFASDCVAGVIEGLADRQTNIRIRLIDYKSKLAQLFGFYARLDMMFPEEDVLDMLQSPKMFMETMNYEARDLEQAFIVTALDMMYFWMYQPRARKALELIAKDMSNEEWLILYRSQLILKRYKEISQVFVDGLVGKHFSKALAFYLEQYDKYLAGMKGISRAKGLLASKEEGS
jgi:hypothetical protein